MKLTRENKEHIYSKGPMYVPVWDTKNKGQFLKEYTKENNVWYDFLDYIVYQGRSLGLPPEEQCHLILEELRNPIDKQTFSSALVNDEGYNPFFDNIPIDKFDEELKSKILEIQEFIKKYYNIQFVYNKIFVMYDNEKEVIFDYFNNQVDYCDIILLFKKNKMTFYLLKRGYDNKDKFVEIFNYLNMKESNVWEISQNKKKIATKDNFNSDLFILNNIEIFDIYNK